MFYDMVMSWLCAVRCNVWPIDSHAHMSHLLNGELGCMRVCGWLVPIQRVTWGHPTQPLLALPSSHIPISHIRI